jgi:hypothetical protein
VVVEAWKFFGEAEPPSDALYEACQAYWTACGRGQMTNWPQIVEQAIADDNGWITETFRAVQ